MKICRRFLLIILICLSGCQPQRSSLQKLTIGVVSFEQGETSIAQYTPLKNYLETQLKSVIELEPAYNEIQALQQIRQQKWDIVFAASGLAAEAISLSYYEAIFPLEGGQNERSVIIVLQESPINQLTDLSGSTVALGQPGSTTGYYLPIYNLYGLTLAEAIFAATPKKVFELLAEQRAAAGAVSLSEFNRYRSSINTANFRIIYTDAHAVPSGSVLISSKLPAVPQQQIKQTLAQVPSTIAASAGYVTNAPPPDYSYLIEVVERVRPIAARITEKPAPLYEQR